MTSRHAYSAVGSRLSTFPRQDWGGSALKICQPAAAQKGDGEGDLRLPVDRLRWMFLRRRRLS